jgi:acetylglutamate kinase
VGLSGKDGKLISAKKMKYMRKRDEDPVPEIIDMGMVGEITAVDTGILLSLMEKEFIPVIAPVGSGSNGETYNINADLVAGKVASALGARKLVLLTDTEGVLDEKGNLISTLKMQEAKAGISGGIIKGGMIPKVNCCLAALGEGVKKTHIIDGREPHSILLEILTKIGVGTEIVQ